VALNIVIVGFGTVGQGFARILDERRRVLAKKGARFRVVGVLDSKGAAIDKGGLDLLKLLARKKSTGTVGKSEASLREVIMRGDADTVVELTPGTMSGEPAFAHMRTALDESKSVVTANKMPLALHFSELTRTTAKRHARLLYSACVGGGLPVLEFGRECAAAEPVDGIEGVVNATTNFILSEMENGVKYGHALKRAQELGYAEPDPSFDVDGLDAACKIVILANHVMGTSFRLRDVKPLEGIGGVTARQVEGARRKGKALRLVAKARGSLSVVPTEVPMHSPLAATGRSHAVVFHCRYSAERTIMGSGAGSVTTSLGVLRDLLKLEDGTVA
jgi:homoserine dehydrogenase